MLAIAKTLPRAMAALKQVKGIGQELLDRRGTEILAAVHRGLAVPEDQLPRVQRPTRRPPDLAYDARLERLKAVRTGLAQRYHLAPGVLCPNGTLEAIAKTNPTTLDQMAGVRELRRWQVNEFGPELLASLGDSASAR
jgi:ribonuclease D